jgi:peptidoglycan/xylan/chitin deacetylase (PgdA/CDA1 family)
MRLIALLAGLLTATAGSGQSFGDAPVPATQHVVPEDLHARFPNWTFDHGGVVRGDQSKKELALIFTGGDFGEGTGQILDTLKARDIKASFFFTGAFLKKPELQESIKRIVAEGHYLGPHSDNHPLYCPWEDRNKTLVSEEFFKNDLQKNINHLTQRFIGARGEGQGASRNALAPVPSPIAPAPVYFIPPYEWFNEDQVRWSRDMGVLLFNFTPGSGSNRDWAPESHKSFVPSQKIIDDILAYESEDPHGLNGFLLLLHAGSERKDKPFGLFGRLFDDLIGRQYRFVRVDELLATPPR